MQLESLNEKDLSVAFKTMDMDGDGLVSYGMPLLHLVSSFFHFLISPPPSMPRPEHTHPPAAHPLYTLAKPLATAAAPAHACALSCPEATITSPTHLQPYIP
jgi:hypothetical protein